MTNATMIKSTPTPTAGLSTLAPSPSLWPRRWLSSPSTYTLRKTKKSAGRRGASSSAHSHRPLRTHGYPVSATAGGRQTPALIPQKRRGKIRQWAA